MTLQEFLSYYGISTTSLEEIKKRVFVVGKFNTSEKEVGAYLFSRTRRPDNRYKASRDLSYASFIDVLKPTLTEYFKKEEVALGEVIPYFDLAPQEGRSEEGNENNSTYVIDPYNYFFQRAVNTSEHPHYTKNPISSLRLPEYTAGETIYKEIRANLNRFCSFQHKNFDLIRAFAQLLHKNRGKGGIPNSYADGAPLPQKFVPLLIDFLYQEGTEAFSITEIDFSTDRMWETAAEGLQKSTFYNTFPKIVTAFKNYLIDPKSIERESIPGIDLTPLKSLVDEKLRLAFVASRNAHNMLKQIIKSKVLLSMVLQWALEFFRKLPSAEKAVADIDKARAIEHAIKNGEDGLAHPGQKLPDGTSVGDLIASFRQNFSTVLKYVNDVIRLDELKSGVAFENEPGENLEGTIEALERVIEDTYFKLSPFLQDIALKLLKDNAKRANIRLIMNMRAEQKEAIIKALQNYFVDVVIPRMFKEPGLTLEELKKKFRTYEEVLFQQSVLMDTADTTSMNIDIEVGKSFEETVANVVTVSIEFFVKEEVVKSFIKTSILVENINTQRSLLTSPETLGSMVTTLPPIDNGQTAPYTSGLTQPAARQIVKELELERPQTIEKIKALPSATNQNKGGLLLQHRKNKLLEAGDTEENTETAVIVSDEVKSMQLIESKLMEKLEKEGSVSLTKTLQKYANATGDMRLAALEEVKGVIHEGVKGYNFNLSRVYSKYAAPTALPVFKSMVEALTLCQLLLVNQDKLNLNKAGTNLYDLLLDMVEFMHDPEQPDLKTFFAEHSLTQYVSAQHFLHNGEGFSALEAILKNQADESLKNVKQYVSELQGVKYLFDVLNKSQSDCEVVVLNAYSHEFINWTIKNLNEGEGNFFDPARLTNNNDNQPQFPVVAFMTDLSFNNNGYERTFSEKRNFLQTLKDRFATIGAESRNIALFPPLCIATSSAGNSKEWINQGNELNQLASDLYNPLLILGPSLYLNSKKDEKFATTLSAGYVFCAHLLNRGQEQAVEMKNVNGLSTGRFQVIGYGAVGVSTTIKNLIEDPIAGYSFAGDFYLYLISLLAIAAEFKYSGKKPDYRLLNIGIGQDFWQAFYNMFNYNAVNKPRESQLLDKANLYKQMAEWTLSDDINTGQDLKGVRLFQNGRRDHFNEMKEVEWFNNLTNLLKIKKEGTDAPPIV